MPIDLDALSLFAQSFGIGFAVAAPVGPMALLCIGRSLKFGSGNGLLFGSGIAAAADASYAAIAAAGLSAVTAALVGVTPWVKGIGGLILLWLGWKTLRTPAVATNGSVQPAPAGERLRAFASAYGLTITNPPTIIFFASVFASLGGISAGLQAGLFPLGVFLGSLAWWLILVGAIRHGRAWLTPPVLVWINRISGAVLIGFALSGLADLLPA